MVNRKDFISMLMIAIANCSLYSKQHEAFDELANRTFSLLSNILEERFEIMIIDSELIVDKKPLRDAGIHRTNLIKRLKRKGVSRVDFIKGITISEIKQFIIDLAGNQRELNSSDHIKIGNVDVRLAVPETEDNSVINSSIDSLSGQTHKIQDIFHSASPFKKLSIVGLEEVVAHFITTFRREANILKYLSPVKTFSEYTYTHATNVSVLSLFQAESFGIKGDVLHEIGIAALLHDAGKLFISKEILEKQGRLDDREFAEIKSHPLHGARYLSTIDGLTRLAPIIAFQHHMKYDGSGYPDMKLNGKKQHIYSQIVAIADFFDAMRSHRPYRKSWEIHEILALMKKNAGTEFNPSLVDNFISIMQTTLANK